MSKEIKLSATRVSTFLDCKQKYWFNYHDRLPKKANPAFKLGIAVHEALEFAGKIWLKKGEFSSEDKKKVLDYYNETSISEGVSDLSLHKQGADIVRAKLDDFMLGEKLISLEYKFGFYGEDVITRDGVSLIGAIDKVSEIDDDTLLVIDYKTSSTAPTQDQLKTDLQLSIYDLVASLKWPKYKRVILCLDLLKHEPVYTYRTDQERDEISDYLTIVHDAMVRMKKRDAKPSLNLFCPWCDFKDYCHTYKKAYDKTNYSFEASERYEDVDLMNEWTRMRDTKKIVETRERELAMLIIEKIRRSGSNIHNDEKEMYIRQNSRTGFDLKEVHRLVPEKDFLDMIKLKDAAVKRYINRKTKVKNEILKSSQSNYTSPFLSTRKLRKK